MPVFGLPTKLCGPVSDTWSNMGGGGGDGGLIVLIR